MPPSSWSAIALLGRVAGDAAFMAVLFGSAWLMGFVVASGPGSSSMSGDNRDLAQRLSEATALLAEAERRRPQRRRQPRPRATLPP